ncbi:MAG: hypothetical protein GY943_22820 [Chloroflexi bacterium]|nr:hypothetical protein [Chloroflexota bacterium]
MDKRKVLLFVGIPVVLIGLCICIAAVIMIASDSQSSDDTEENGRTRNKRALAQACFGNGVPEAAAYGADAGVHPVAFMEKGDDDYTFITNPGPSAWTPTFLEDAQLVVCVDEQAQVELEVCEYTLDAGGDASITRMGINATYRLVEAQTGGELVMDKVTAVPRDCLDEEQFSEGLEHTTIYASLPDELVPLIESYVETP